MLSKKKRTIKMGRVLIATIVYISFAVLGYFNGLIVGVIVWGF